MLRGAELWLSSYLRHPKRRQFDSPTDVMIAVCDHFEPFHHSDKCGALRRVADWEERFPKLGDQFRDTGGHPPKQTLFYPIEQYDEDVLDQIAALCRNSGSEVEIHLHHDNDKEENFRTVIEQGKRDFERHGLLSLDASNRLTYGFIHGNWALDNSDPSGRNCGLQRELQILKETGCYADFTMPSAPHPTQTRTVNQIYYAAETNAPKSHDSGFRLQAKDRRANATKLPSGTAELRSRIDHLLMVQGPLGLNWERRKWGLLPRLENADLTGANPATRDRWKIWTENAIHVQGQPSWLFIKLHTHGAINPNRAMLLGSPMESFHAELKKLCGPETPFRLHYVSAREMVNIIHAAEDGNQGNPDDYRNYLTSSRIEFAAGALPRSS